MASMRQGVLLVLQAVAVELLVAVGAAATQGLQGGRGAAARDGRRAGGVVLSQTWHRTRKSQQISQQGKRQVSL